MRGFLLERVDGVPQLADLPDPVAEGPHAVVDVLAAGVNPVDLNMAADASRPVPRVVGNEAVVALGGRRVYAERTVAPHGSFAERAIVDPAIAIPLPDDISTEAALAVGIAGLAAWVPLKELARLRPGEVVVVLGATGSVGRIAVQVARLLGASRVVAVGRNTDRLARVAADTRVALTGDPEADADAIREASGGEGADVVLDPVYGPPMLAALAATRLAARVVLVGATAATSVEVPFNVVRGRTLLTHSNQLTDPQTKRAAYEQLIGHVVAGRIETEATVLPLTEAAEAWRRQSGSPGTKLILDPEA